MSSSKGIFNEDVGSMHPTVESWSESELSDFKDEQKTIKMLQCSFEKQDDEDKLLTSDFRTFSSEDWVRRCSNSNGLPYFTQSKDPQSSSTRKCYEPAYYDHQKYLVESMTGVFLSDADSDSDNENNVDSKSITENENESSVSENSKAENTGSTAENKGSAAENNQTRMNCRNPSQRGWFQNGNCSRRFVGQSAPFPSERRRLSMPNTSELHQKAEMKGDVSFQEPLSSRQDSSGSVPSSVGCRRKSLPEYYDMAKTSASFHAAVHAELFPGHPIVNYGYCKTTVGPLNMTVYSQDIPQLESFSRQHSSHNSCESLASPSIDSPNESSVKYEWMGHPTEVSVGPVQRYVGLPYNRMPLMNNSEITGAWNPTPPKYPEINYEGFLKSKRI